MSDVCTEVAQMAVRKLIFHARFNLRIRENIISQLGLSATHTTSKHCNFVFFTNFENTGVWIDKQNKHFPSIRYIM